MDCVNYSAPIYLRRGPGHLPEGETTRVLKLVHLVHLPTSESKERQTICPLHRAESKQWPARGRWHRDC
jgi:hypothetical protein